MILPLRTPPDPAHAMRDLDRAWSEHLADEASRFARMERRSGVRRAWVGVLIAIAVVAGGVAGFRYETDTRWATIHPVRSPGYVTVTVERR